MRSTFDILRDLAPEWDRMGAAQKVALGTTLAGTNQYKIFAAVMNNFDTAIKASEESLNSMGATEKQNAIYMDSIEAKSAQLRAEFEKLVLGEGGLQSFAKKMLDLGVNLLKFANNDVVQTIAKIILLTQAIKLLTSQVLPLLISTVLPKVIGMFQKFIGVIQNVAAALSLLKEGGRVGDVMGALLTGINPVQLALTALVVVIGLVVKAVKAWNARYDEHLSKLNEAQDVYKTTSQSIKELKDQLDDIEKSKIGASDEELTTLTQQEENLKRQLALETQKLQIARDQAKIEAEKLLTIKQQSNIDRYVTSSGETVGGHKVTITDDIEELTLAYDDLQQKIENYKQQQLDLIDNNGKIKEGYESDYQTLEDQINLGEQMLVQFVESGNAQVTQLLSIADALKGSPIYNILIALVDEWNKVTGASEETQKTTKDLATDYGDLTDAVRDYMNEHDVSEEEAFAAVLEEQQNQINELADAYREAFSAVTDMGSAFDTLNSAVDDYNTNGYVSEQNLKNLLSLGDEYLSLLTVTENGLELDSAAAEAYANSLIDEAEAKAIASAEADILAHANSGITDSATQAGEAGASMYKTLTGGGGVAVSALGAISKSAETLKAKLLDAAKAGVAMNEGIKQGHFTYSGDTIVYHGKGETDAYTTQRMNALNAELKVLEGLRANIGKMTSGTASNTKATNSNTGSRKGNTSATKANTDAVKENVEALKKQKEALQAIVKEYETVISYIKSKVDERIDELEKLKDAEVDSIDAQIEELEKLKDIDEEYWDAKLEALKAQNEELEDQIEYQKLLEALEKAKTKKVRVYKEGIGYVYQTDESEVNKAQQDINDYQRKKKYDDEIKDLEKAKDRKQQIYKQEIDSLKQHRENVKLQYDLQIQYYKNWQEKFQSAVDSYENEQNRLKALELTGIDFEAQGWETRLNNLDSFVTDYKKYLADLEKAIAEYNKAQSSINTTVPSTGGSSSGGSYGGGGGGTGGSSAPSNGDANGNGYIDEGEYWCWDKGSEWWYYDVNSRTWTKGGTTSTNTGVIHVYQVDSTYAYGTNSSGKTIRLYRSDINRPAPNSSYSFASGVASIKDDQIAITGENPYQEIVLGSKANGVLTKMDKGAGVVNAKSTKTVAGLLNQIGAYGSRLLSGNDSLANHENSAMNINISNINLPQVKDGRSFVDYLQNFSMDIKQKAYI